MAQILADILTYGSTYILVRSSGAARTSPTSRKVREKWGTQVLSKNRASRFLLFSGAGIQEWRAVGSDLGEVEHLGNGVGGYWRCRTSSITALPPLSTV